MDLTVEVIKGALARQRYGTDAGSGVILMTTKQPARAGAIR
jgi:outer membrane receptor for ferrienterochelin and colicin